MFYLITALATGILGMKLLARLIDRADAVAPAEPEPQPDGDCFPQPVMWLVRDVDHPQHIRTGGDAEHAA